jgi:hypothetical protein
MTLKEKSAVEVLKSAHNRILDILGTYNEKLSAADKEKVLADVSFELSVLSVLENDVFYPAIAEADSAFKMDEFVESHDRIKISMAQAQRLMGEEPDFDPHMKELCKLVKQHIDKENSELFANLKDSSVDLEAVGDGLNQRSKEFSSHINYEGKPGDLGFTI